MYALRGCTVADTGDAAGIDRRKRAKPQGAQRRSVAVGSIVFHGPFYCLVSFESSALCYSVKHAVHHALSACASRSSADAPVSSSYPLSHALATAARLLQSVPLVFARALTKSLQQASEEFAQLMPQLRKVTALAHSQMPLMQHSLYVV
jgi:hypothetical protein